jgi:transposase
MAQALSRDLRNRLIEAVNAGASRRSVAERFRVAPSTVVKLMRRWASQGTSAPRARGGDRKSHTIEVHAAEIIALIELQVDITLVEISERIEARHGQRFAPSVICRLLQRHDWTRKKNRTRQRTNSRGRCSAA